MGTSKSTKEGAETPLMKQYNSIKAKYPDALLLFRVGDFYETFGEDAVKAANILGIVLTRRANGSAQFIELAGFPHHSLDNYLPKLVRAGMRVAICDQLEDPKMTKTIVKRGVTELVTPGVTLNDKVLDHKRNNFLASVFIAEDQSGVSFLDISTGEFYTAQGKHEYIDKLIQSFKPTEILYQKQLRKRFYELFGDRFYSYGLEDWVFTSDFAHETLLRHFNTKSLKGFGIENLTLGVISAGAALHYLADTQHDKVQHISSIARIEEEDHVWLDKFTIRNLELFYSANENAKTLMHVIDQTVSPMGSRMLQRWVALPLKDLKTIHQRQECVQFLFEHAELARSLSQEVHQAGDMERMISRVAVNKVNPREVMQLLRALKSVAAVKQSIFESQHPMLLQLGEQLNPCSIIAQRIERELQADAPVQVAKGNVIAKGIHPELDELRQIAYAGKEYLAEIQQRESERTGIPSLKVAFNNVFGYYLEVTNAHKDKVPAEWIRKQTLVNAERYITEELKRFEEKILGAEEKILTLETQLFNDLVFAINEYVSSIQLNASLLARLDCLLSFAHVAKSNQYVKPEVNDSKLIDIKQGRHPVIEQQLPLGESYIENDVYLDTDQQQIMMITGPNMSGKSALLRQTALIVLLAQIGSFVPAQAATIGLVDKIFTRVGASDNISSGESTFMVEMNETASILNNLSDRSLVLLDEIGRGTSTYDGISIAWAIAEYLHEQPINKAKTLFATHYHELNDMAQQFIRIKNFNVSIREVNNKVIFLRKLIPGGSEHSFGIHVAKMAGMPQQVLDRANLMLKHLEQSHAQGEQNRNGKNPTKKEDSMQLSFFQLEDPVLQQIKEEIVKTDINILTPVEALLKLNEIKKIIGG